MECPGCKSKELVGKVVVEKLLPLASRNGTIKVGGQAVTQMDIKELWDGKPDDPKSIKGPILCMDCGTEMVYVVGLAKPLKIMAYEEAVALGHEYFVGEK